MPFAILITILSRHTLCEFISMCAHVSPKFFQDYIKLIFLFILWHEFSDIFFLFLVPHYAYLNPKLHYACSIPEVANLRNNQTNNLIRYMILTLECYSYITYLSCIFIDISVTLHHQMLYLHLFNFLRNDLVWEYKFNWTLVIRPTNSICNVKAKFSFSSYAYIL